MRTFVNGKIYSRSHGVSKGLPSETEIFNLNPRRQEMLNPVHHWKQVFPGTLNLKISDEDLAKIQKMTPVWTETDCLYPSKYSYIPKKREAYLYYKGRLKTSSRKRHPVIVKMGRVPVKRCVEVISDINLRDHLSLKDKESVNLRITSHKGTTTKAKTKNTIGIPILTNHENNSLNLHNIHANAHAFLCLSGPSINTVDLSCLKFVYKMCVNNSSRALMPNVRANAQVFVDSPDKFLYTNWFDPQTLNIVPHGFNNKWIWNCDAKDSAKKQVKDCPNVAYYQRNNGFDPETFLTENTFNWGNSKEYSDENFRTGCRSVMLVAIKLLYYLGFRHVYLLGCDFNMSETQKYSFDQGRKNSAIRNNNSTYKQLDWRFKKLLSTFKKAKFNVYNCNKDSALTAFPYLSYSDAINQALNFTGDPAKYMKNELENTAGLYETKWYVCPGCNSNLRMSKDECKQGYHCPCGRQVTEEDRNKYCKDKSMVELAS